MGQDIQLAGQNQQHLQECVVREPVPSHNSLLYLRFEFASPMYLDHYSYAYIQVDKT